MEKKDRLRILTVIHALDEQDDETTRALAKRIEDDIKTKGTAEVTRTELAIIIEAVQTHFTNIRKLLKQAEERRNVHR